MLRGKHFVWNLLSGPIWMSPHFLTIHFSIHLSIHLNKFWSTGLTKPLVCSLTSSHVWIGLTIVCIFQDKCKIHTRSNPHCPPQALPHYPIVFKPQQQQGSSLSQDPLFTFWAFFASHLTTSLSPCPFLALVSSTVIGCGADRWSSSSRSKYLSSPKCIERGKSLQGIMIWIPVNSLVICGILDIFTKSRSIFDFILHC